MITIGGENAMKTGIEIHLLDNGHVLGVIIRVQLEECRRKAAGGNTYDQTDSSH